MGKCFFFREKLFVYNNICSEFPKNQCYKTMTFCQPLLIAKHLWSVYLQGVGKYRSDHKC